MDSLDKAEEDEFHKLLGASLDDPELMVALGAFDIILGDYRIDKSAFFRDHRCFAQRVWRWCRRGRKCGRAAHMVEAFGHISLDVFSFPHMTLILQLLEDPNTLIDVVVEVVQRLKKAPVSVLEPHVGPLVRLLERDGGENMVLHKFVGPLLQRLPTHWLAPYLSNIMRAWNTSLVKGWGRVEEEVDDEDDGDCTWEWSYDRGRDYYEKTEEDQDHGW